MITMRMTGGLLGGRTRLRWIGTGALAGLLLAMLPTGATAAVTTLYVDQNNRNCSNTGSGTQTVPFCTIQRAADLATQGTTVLVSSGTYIENVTPPTSGTSTAPITFKPATGAAVTVSSKIHAFTVSQSWITISGFTVTGTTSYGIYLKLASHITLDGNHVTNSGKPANGSTAQGIYVKDTTDSLIVGNVTDHNSDTGIYVTTGVSGLEIRGNHSFANARQYTRAATGIDVRSAGNRVIGNIANNNEDSGIQLYNGATNTIVADNLVYGNGDHGIDVLNSTNAVVVANTVYQSLTSGINFEGASGTSASSNATVRNNISVDNGLTSSTTKGNIRVDASSTPGTTLDYDQVSLSSAGTMMTWGTKTYTTLSGFTAASNQETHGFQDDPRWVAPAGGDFHLQSGSRAIDSADSSAPNQPSTDLDGDPRVDDPATPNIGVGPRTYDDRGAFEYQPDRPPAAALTVSPNSGVAPLDVTADASGSTDTDATPIATYAFDFGDGSPLVGPQPGATATHTYSAAGTYTVTVTVSDTAGKSATATGRVTVTSSDNPPNAVLTVTPDSGAAPLDVTADASGSTDTDATPIATYTFDFGDGSPLVGPQPGATATHTYTAVGTYSAKVTVTDTGGASATVTATVTVGNGTVDEVHYSYLGPTSVAFDWRGGPNTIRYGTTTSYGGSVTASTPSPLPFSSSGPFWEAKLTGLTPATTYHYSIGGSADATFTTSPAGNLRFDAMADVGDSVTYKAMGTTQAQIAQDNPAFVLVAGDLTYGEAHGQAAVDQHFNDVMAWSTTAAYMPAWGNHEYEASTDDLRNYKGRFALPNAQTSPGAPSLGCCGEDWGWFDAGGVRFISYPEPYAGTTWTDWQSKAEPIMASAQRDPNINFIVTFGHRPAYSTGAHDGSAELKAILDGLGDKYTKYALNVNGHSHDYERFVPQHGVVHVTTGGGGASLETPWTSTDPNTAFRAMHLEHLRVDVSATALTVDSVCGPSSSKDDYTCSLGSVMDSVTIPAPPASDDPPAAALTVTPPSGTAPVAVTADASASTDTDATPIAGYAFDFGDGFKTAAQASPLATHTYTTVGTFTVKVTVTDTAGRPSSATRQVIVSAPTNDNPPSAALSVTPSSGPSPLTVTADASGSTDTDATPIAGYAFDFGDGFKTAAQASPLATHTYTTVGTFTVKVTVTDTAGRPSSATRQVAVSAPTNDNPPSAALSVTPSSGPSPLTVTADASGSTDTDASPISTYAFDFGDGTRTANQTAATATHTYTTSGTYTVTVTVTDTAGKTATATAGVNVGTADSPPAAALTVTPTTGTVPLAVTADASASTDTDATPIASYRFDFGDGTVAGPQAGATATHTYTAAGTFTVTVTVTDTAGQSSRATQQVSVALAGGTNLVGNPGFETGTTGWNANGRTGIAVTQDSSAAHSGGYSALLANTTTTTQADCTLNDSPNWVKTTQAGTYEAGLWVKAATAGASFKLRIREYNGSTFVAQAVTTVTLGTSWQQVKVTYVPQVVGSTLDYTGYITNAPPGTCFNADDASITVS